MLMRCLMTTETWPAIIYEKKSKYQVETFCAQYNVPLGSIQVQNNSNCPIMLVAAEDMKNLQGAGLFWSAAKLSASGEQVYLLLQM